MEKNSLDRIIQIPRFPFIVRHDRYGKMAVIEHVKNSEEPWSMARFDDLARALWMLELQHINVEGLRDAIPLVCSGKPYCFARAVEPVHGQNGSIQCSFVENIAETMWSQSDDERVDFRNRKEINNVRAGDLLAELIPPTPGRDGMTILGQKIVAKVGKPARMVAGKNVRLDADGLRAYAVLDGCVRKINTIISVDPVRFIDGDVGFKCGNIEFNGDVVVTGDVNETFSIKAEGNIQVHGIVDRANLQAGGDITIGGGIYGKDGVGLKAAGNVFVCFAENAHIEAGGNIYVKASMVSSFAHAGGKLFLQATGKALIGGHVIADKGVWANSLGNPRLPTKTIVEFGPRPELIQRARALKTEFENSDEERRVAIYNDLMAIQEELRVMMRARVIARHITYPGVVLVSGKASYEARSEISRMLFYTVPSRNEIYMRGVGPQQAADYQMDDEEEDPV